MCCALGALLVALAAAWRRLAPLARLAAAAAGAAMLAAAGAALAAAPAAAPLAYLHICGLEGANP